MRNPYVVVLGAVGVLALVVAALLGIGLGDSPDPATAARGAMVGQVVPLVISLGVGVLTLVCAALLAGIGWEFRRDRAEWATPPGEPGPQPQAAAQPDAVP